MPAVVLFDGECTMCRAAVRFIATRDRDGRFAFARQDGSVGHALLAEHGLDHERGRTLVLVEDGRAYLRSDAVLRIGRRLPSTRWAAAAAALLPRRWRDAVYDLVARHRPRRSRSPASCPAPGPELRRRFLDREES